MAEYREHEKAFEAAGAKLAAISVDSPEKSQAVRDELRLKFPVLCDTHRRVVREWGVYNAREKGGIAKPAIFVLNPARVVRFVSVDEIASRIPASEIVRILFNPDRIVEPHRRRVVPHPGNFWRAVSNAIHFGAREPDSSTK
ncbi:MAG: peroxiredoxin family protein [Acidobacteriota bacterium]|nr:peroxiredoxin family protein [Acidobacteriota bacterium]